jgi:pimeloyl-ACP methyl ester carboxylesterase
LGARLFGSRVDGKSEQELDDELRGYVVTSGGLVHYRAAGSAGPAVVLLHEAPLSSAIYERLLARLAESVRAWALDTPGYGMSDPPPEPCGVADYARTLLEAIDALGLERFVLVGARTGAHIALEIARVVGTRIQCLIVTGVLVLPAAERAERLAAITDPTTNAPARLTLDGDGRHLLWAWNRYRRNEDTPLDLANLSAVHACANPERHNWGYAATYSHDASPLLEMLAQPTLLLTSSADPLSASDGEVLRRLANGSIRSVEGGCQKAYWEAPDAYAEGVLEFMAKHCEMA